MSCLSSLKGVCVRTEEEEYEGVDEEGHKKENENENGKEASVESWRLINIFLATSAENKR